MDVFDKDNKYLTKVFDPNQDDNSKINHQLIKDIIFTDKKDYKYHPQFTRIFYISPDFKQMNIISVFDEVSKEAANLDNPEFSKNFFKYLQNEYKISQEVINDVVSVVKGQNQAVIDNIMSSYPEIKNNVNNYFNLLGSPQSSKASSPQSSKASSPQSSKESSRSSSRRSSISYAPTEASMGDIFELLNKEVTVKEKIKDEIFDIRLKYYYQVLSKPNPLIETQYIDIFKNFVLNANFLAIGMQITGDSKFKVVKTDDKKKQKLIKIFTHSEHKVSQVKALVQDTLYFLYFINDNIHIHGELRKNSVIILKIILSDKMTLKDLENVEKEVNDNATKIFNVFKLKIPNLIENQIKNAIKIAIKITNPKGRISKDIVKDNFVQELKETHGGKILTFDLLTLSQTVIKRVIYSEKAGVSNFSIKEIPDKSYIPDIINKLSYIFKGGAKIIEPIKKETKKLNIKTLASAGIPYDSRKCQKDRRIEILAEGEETKYVDSQKMKYKDNVLVCKNLDYPFPGITKTGIPCCFKKIQGTLKVNEEFSVFDAFKSLNIRPLIKEKEELVQYRREGISNRLLSDIFPAEQGYYGITMSNVKIGIPEILQSLYGADVVERSFNELSEEDKKYLNTIDKNDPKSVASVVGFYKKVNVLVINYNDNDFSFTCSNTDTFFFDNYLVMLFAKDNYKLLTKTLDSGQLAWLIGKSNVNMQRLIRAYNKSCMNISECSYIIPDVKKILLDGKITVKNGLVDPVSNMISYLETDMGIIPVKTSPIFYKLKTKTMKDIVKLGYAQQKDKLNELSKQYEYLKVVGNVYDETKKNITGLKTVCGLLVPVIEQKEDSNVKDSDKQVFNIDVLNTLKDTIMSGEELNIFNESFFDNYKKIVLNTLKKYFNELENEKKKIIDLADNSSFEDIILMLNGLLVSKENVDIPIENTTVVPIPIPENQKVNMLSYIAWSVINNGEEIFSNDISGDKQIVDVSMIPNMEEVIIS